jgi:hypothetical protein
MGPDWQYWRVGDTAKEQNQNSRKKAQKAQKKMKKTNSSSRTKGSRGRGERGGVAVRRRTLCTRRVLSFAFFAPFCGYSDFLRL